MEKKVIELLRVSTSGQAGPDRAGITAQRAANRQTAKRDGLEIVKPIEMSDVSGAALLHAPKCRRCSGCRLTLAGMQIRNRGGLNYADFGPLAFKRYFK